MINFIFNILYFFIVVLLPFILVIGFFIILEKLQERNEVQLDDTSKIFRYGLKGGENE